MKAEDFKSGYPGRLEPITLSDGSTSVAFFPLALQQLTVDLSAETYRWIAEARASLGELQGSIKGMMSLPIVRPALLRREAHHTSLIEGTQTELHDVVNAQRGETDDKAMREVLNFVDVSDMAYRHLESVADDPFIPISLLYQLQYELVSGVTEERIQIGRTRTTQVFIGNKNQSIHSAIFVPSPPGHNLDIALQELIDYINQKEHNYDPIIAVALAHYQFETLHPFFDGNGRLGRLLILLQLVILGQLYQPVLSISTWLEENRDSYYSRLQRVRTHNEWDHWVRFMAKVIYHSAKQTLDLIETISQLNEDLHNKVRESKLKAETNHRVIDLAFEMLNFSIQDVAAACDVGEDRARKIVKDLINLNILARQGTARKQRFTCPAIAKTLDQTNPATYRIDEY